MQILIIISFVGFLFSLYLFYVEQKLEKNKNYKAVCDISDAMSCTFIAKSEYSHVGGIRNSIKGLLYYPLIIVLTLTGFIPLVFYLSVVSMIMTVYLAYVSYFKLKNYCVVCIGIYLVNILLFYFSYSLY